MKLLARFLLNRFLVRLHAMDALRVKIVFLLFANHFCVQRLIIVFFLFVNDHSIRAKHDVNEHQASKYGNNNCGNAPPQEKHPSSQGPDALHPRRSQRFGVRSFFRHRAQPIVRAGKSPDFCKVSH